MIITLSIIIMKHIFVAIILSMSLAFFNVSVASEPNVREMSPRERIFVGGYLGLQIGNIHSTVGLHLHGGYLLTNRLSAGVGGNYQYNNFRWLNDSYSSHIYGANAFMRFRVVSGFFLHAEYERLNLQSYLPDKPPEDRPRVTEDNYLLGVGYAIPLSGRVRLNLLMLYDLEDNSQVYFDNPFFRVGVDVFIF